MDKKTMNSSVSEDKKSVYGMKIDITKLICENEGYDRQWNGGYNKNDWQQAIIKSEEKIDELKNYYQKNWGIDKPYYLLVEELYDEMSGKGNITTSKQVVSPMAKKDKKITVKDFLNDVLSDKEIKQLDYFKRAIKNNEAAIRQAGLVVRTINQTKQITSLNHQILNGKFNSLSGVCRKPVERGDNPPLPPIDCIDRLIFLNSLCGVDKHLSTEKSDYLVYIFEINGNDWVVAESDKMGNAAYMFKTKPDPAWINQFGEVLLGHKGKDTWKNLPGFAAKIVHKNHDKEYKGSFTDCHGTRPYWQGRMLEEFEK